MVPHRVPSAERPAAARLAVVGDVAQPDDFLYIDPPYAPISATANFTSYTATPFTAGDQKRLQEMVIELAARGCRVLVSNSTAPEIVDLYDASAARQAGLRATRVPARRSVNRDATRRGPIDELLISNLPPRGVA